MKFRGTALVGTVVLVPLTGLAFFACNFEEDKASIPTHAPTIVSTAGDASQVASGLDGGEEPDAEAPYPTLVSLGGTCGDGICDPLKLETNATCIDCAPKPIAGDGVCEPAECGTADCGICWYAAPVAAAAADGSAAKPYALTTLLGNGVPAVKAGDTIWVTAGVYGTNATPAIPVTIKGTAAAPIRVEALPNAAVTIAPGLAGAAAEYVTFARMTIANDGANRIAGSRPLGVEFSRGLRLSDVQILDTGARGVVVHAGDAILEGCTLHGNGVRTAAAATTYEGQALRVEGNVGTVTVTGSLFTRNFTNAIDIEASTTGGTITIDGNGFLDQPSGAVVVNPDPDTTVGTVTLRNNVALFRGDANTLTADRGISIGVKDDAVARQDKVELEDNLLVSLGVDKGEPIVSLVDYSGFVSVLRNEFRGPNLVRDWTWLGTGQGWDANRYIVPNGLDTGTYFDDAVLPAAGAPITFAGWKSLSRDPSSTLAFVLGDETRILGRRLDLRDLRAALFVNRTVAKPTLVLDLRPYVRVGEKYTLVDASARGAVVQPATIYDGRPLTVTLPVTPPVALSGTATDLPSSSQRLSAAPSFYAFHVRVSP